MPGGHRRGGVYSQRDVGLAGQPGAYYAQIVSGIGFLGAGVIMRDGMNVRGLNTAATLWCSAGIGVLCGLGQFWNATAATLIILCANILLREAAQRIHICLPGPVTKRNAMYASPVCANMKMPYVAVAEYCAAATVYPAGDCSRRRRTQRTIWRFARS